jgi:type III restriction enzyme
LYPAELDTWEEKVLRAKMKRDGFKFWYRNPDRPSQDSLGIAYTNGDDTKIVRPDFIFFGEQNGEVVADIIDPHGSYLADALPKLQGLARYTESHSQVFRRIEAVAEIDGKLRVLNLSSLDVRKAILEATNAESLYKSAVAGDYQ